MVCAPHVLLNPPYAPETTWAFKLRSLSRPSSCPKFWNGKSEPKTLFSGSRCCFDATAVLLTMSRSAFSQWLGSLFDIRRRAASFFSSKRPPTSRTCTLTPGS